VFFEGDLVAVVSSPKSGALSGPRGWRRYADDGFRALTWAMAAVIVVVLLGAAWFVLSEALPSVRHYGPLSFLHTRWAPSEATATQTSPNPYGIIQFIYGTVLTSAIAMIIAVPVSVGVALFITQVCPPRLRRPLSTLTDLLAAVPSVVYGFWALFALLPALRPVARFSDGTLAHVPVLGFFFKGPFFGFSYLAASIVLAIMILPIITAIVREVFATVPKDQKEAAYALGATRWEMIRIAVLPYSKSGIFGASFIGLARALGETIAVTMVIGNNVLEISKSILGQGATLASVIANEFTEANQPFHLDSLFVVAFWLLQITLVVNVVARFIINRSGRVMGGNL
jgi:phosphate transport system permease protein